MNPFIGEINLHTVNVIDFFIFIKFFHLCQNCVDIGFGSQVNAVLCNKIRRIRSTQLTYFLTFMCQMTQEQSNAHQSITSAMAFRVDDSTITFTTDDCICCFHLCHHIYFTYGRSIIFATIFAGYITQSTGRTQIGNCISRSMFQYIISNSYQCIFLTVHLTIFTNHSQTVNVRVNNKSHITAAFCHQSHDITQVLFKRFGVVLEISGRFTI